MILLMFITGYNYEERRNGYEMKEAHPTKLSGIASNILIRRAISPWQIPDLYACQEMFYSYQPTVSTCVLCELALMIKEEVLYTIANWLLNTILSSTLPVPD